jgi:hypothetical protein
MTHILRASAVGERDKYWTGVMIESWPEYLTDRKRAAVVTKQEASQRVAQFTERFDRIRFEWTAEAA